MEVEEVEASSERGGRDRGAEVSQEDEEEEERGGDGGEGGGIEGEGGGGRGGGIEVVPGGGTPTRPPEKGNYFSWFFSVKVLVEPSEYQ
ncbi:hypothetical protein V1477_000592 [Vespula maculifrons]|uniref:Uncharacterized protein n=1 Tax=Vespula maculifrons TaxID=7453 RepID=A0ABD2D237_VESMC